MPFSMRVFCRELESPNLSEVVVGLRQNETPVTISGGASADDLLDSYWTEVLLSYDEDEVPLRLRCVRADAAGLRALTAEIGDFVDDLEELPDTPLRALVLEQLAATRSLLIVELPAEGVSARGQNTADGLTTMFVERAGGLEQIDGRGFIDEYGDVILALG